MSVVRADGPATDPGLARFDRGTVRTRWFSMRVDVRGVWVSLVLLALTVTLGVWSISVGDFPVPVDEVVRTLTGKGTAATQFIVWDLRLPRVLCAVLVGASFGIAGSIFQSLARNPLGSPDVIGFDTGAALGAVFAIVVLRRAGSAEVAAGALLGGFIAAFIVYTCAWKRGIPPFRLVLVGIGIGFMLAAISDYLLTRADINDVQRAAVWLTGSLQYAEWPEVRMSVIGLLVLVPLALGMCKSLRLLELGDDRAAALGTAVSRTRLALVILGVALAALATAAAGPIAFVALVAPPIAHRVVRSPGATIVPAAMLGALLVVAADLLARRLLAPTELPVGIATAALGAPYLLWLLTREIRAGAM